MENFFDDTNPNKEFDAEEHLSEQGYGGNGTVMPGVRTQTADEVSYTPAVNDETIVSDDEYIEELSMEYTQDQAELLDQADSRLEKANLYRMFLNHDLFGNVDCSPAIVLEVQEELKKIILDKLEVLLGIKAEQQNQETQFAVDLPFNALQIEALTLWADKLTKGKSKNAAPAQAIVSKEPAIKPMGGVKKQPTIKKLSGSTNTLVRKRELSKQTVPKTQQIERTNKPRKNMVAEKHREEWVDPKKMTEDERLQHNIKNQDKYKSTPSNGGGVSMPDYSQQSLHYQTQIMARSAEPSPLLQNLQQAIRDTQKDEMMKKMNGG